MVKKKKARISNLDLIYQQFVSDKPDKETEEIAVEQEKIESESRNSEDIIPGCWIRKTEINQAWGQKLYAAKVVKVEENNIIFEFPLEPFLLTPSKHMFISEFERNSKYHVIGEEEGKKIANAHIALVKGNQQMVAESVGKHLGVGGGTGFTGRTADQIPQGCEATQNNDQDGFLSPGYD